MVRLLVANVNDVSLGSGAKPRKATSFGVAQPRPGSSSVAGRVALGHSGVGCVPVCPRRASNPARNADDEAPRCRTIRAESSQSSLVTASARCSTSIRPSPSPRRSRSDISNTCLAVELHRSPRCSTGTVSAPSLIAPSTWAASRRGRRRSLPRWGWSSTLREGGAQDRWPAPPSRRDSAWAASMAALAAPLKPSNTPTSIAPLCRTAWTTLLPSVFRLARVVPAVPSTARGQGARPPRQQRRSEPRQQVHLIVDPALAWRVEPIGTRYSSFTVRPSPTRRSPPVAPTATGTTTQVMGRRPGGSTHRPQIASITSPTGRR